jgi:chromosome segregation ATPase
MAGQLPEKQVLGKRDHGGPPLKGTTHVDPLHVDPLHKKLDDVHKRLEEQRSVDEAQAHRIETLQEYCTIQTSKVEQLQAEIVEQHRCNKHANEKLREVELKLLAAEAQIGAQSENIQANMIMQARMTGMLTSTA